MTESWLKERIAQGATQAMLAAEAQVSITTIRRRLQDLGLRTHGAQARITLEPLDTGDEVRICHRHGRTVFRARPGGGYRCLRCRSEAVSDRRRRVKEQLVVDAGGRCSLCGYDRYVGALAFHHVDPGGKRFSLGQAGVARSLDRAREEASKCVLLCHVCHNEVEAGLVDLEGVPWPSLARDQCDPG